MKVDALTALVKSTPALEEGLQSSPHLEVWLRARRSLKCDLIVVGNTVHTELHLEMLLAQLEVRFNYCRSLN